MPAATMDACDRIGHTLIERLVPLLPHLRLPDGSPAQARAEPVSGVMPGVDIRFDNGPHLLLWVGFNVDRAYLCAQIGMAPPAASGLMNRFIEIAQAHGWRIRLSDSALPIPLPDHAILNACWLPTDAAPLAQIDELASEDEDPITASRWTPTARGLRLVREIALLTQVCLSDACRKPTRPLAARGPVF